MKKLQKIAVTSLLFSISCLHNAHAALVNGSVLSFDAALGGHNGTGINQPLVGTGSWWALPDSNLYLGIESFNGLIVGAVQAVSGSHSGAPDGSESPAIDKAWQLFGSTGMLETTLPTNVISASGNTATLDFSGISIDWNGNDAISIYEPLAGDTGVASIICAVDCGAGEAYILDYLGHTALSPKSGVSFLIHLEGRIAAVPVPAAVWLFASGIVGIFGMFRR